jgi:hypothetical protein
MPIMSLLLKLHVIFPAQPLLRPSVVLPDLLDHLVVRAEFGVARQGNLDEKKHGED